MPISVTYEPDNVCALRVSGVLKYSELAAEQKVMAARIEAGARPRLLAIFENFEGWERSENWNDLEFFMVHGEEIGRIAMVAEPEWQERALAFAGSGLRNAAVKYFPPNEAPAARAWVAQ